MSSKNLVFLVKCADVDGDNWMQVTAKNRYEAAEDYARVVDEETDDEEAWFPKQLEPVKLQVKDPEGNIFEMQVSARQEINYNVADAGM